MAAGEEQKASCVSPNCSTISHAGFCFQFFFCLFSWLLRSSLEKGATAETKSQQSSNRGKKTKRTNASREVDDAAGAAGKRTSVEARGRSITEGANKRVKTLSTMPLLDDSQKCEYANARYDKWFNAALSKSVVTVVATSLPNVDQALLTSLSKLCKKGDGTLSVVVYDQALSYKSLLSLLVFLLQ